MADYEFTMPWPPSVNSWTRAFKSRMILTKRGRDYRVLAIEHLNSIGLSGEMIKDNVAVSLVLNPPSARCYDIDNFCKSLFDAMSKAEFWEDDNQITELHIKKGVKVAGGCVEIKVNLLEN